MAWAAEPVPTLSHPNGCRITFEPYGQDGMVKITSTNSHREPIIWEVGSELGRAMWKKWVAEAGFSKLEQNDE